MIEPTTYHPDWIYEVKRNLGKKKFDPKLIEKVVYALVLLEQLKLNGLDFIFKRYSTIVSNQRAETN